MQATKEYDLFCIGGGSGGNATSKAAVAYGQRVGLADYVKPSPPGTTWGLGGTCVNVGCIPKKLMHFCSLMGEARHDQEGCGWELDPKSIKFNWSKMATKVKEYIGRLNQGKETQLKDKSIDYYNKLASFVDANTVELLDPQTNQKEYVKAKTILISTGGRPNYPDIPGAKEHGITSDDLFYLPENPGKTLIVGASYIALECGGFLTGLGNEVHVLVRSVLLRGFDQDCAERIGEYMTAQGTNFHYKCEPTSVEKLANGKKKVTWKNTQTGESVSQEFDTVLFAIGRTADTAGLQLEKAGIQYNKKNQKVIINDVEQTNIPNIYCVGDCAEGMQELTPVAIAAGRLLAARLYNNKTDKMDYINIPTTVFTPIEYGSCGYSEEAARKVLGDEKIVVFTRQFKSLEWMFAPENHPGRVFIKMICEKEKDMKVIGLHYLGQNSGEIIQGFAIPVKLGLTKEQFDQVVKIHPTAAEEVLTLDNVKTLAKL